MWLIDYKVSMILVAVISLTLCGCITSQEAQQVSQTFFHEIRLIDSVPFSEDLYEVLWRRTEKRSAYSTGLSQVFHGTAALGISMGYDEDPFTYGGMMEKWLVKPQDGEHISYCIYPVGGRCVFDASGEKIPWIQVCKGHMTIGKNKFPAYAITRRGFGFQLRMFVDARKAGLKNDAE